jgi:hypothetical protein
MNGELNNLHPAKRPVEPDHPLVLEGGVIPGDTRFMAQCLFEELLMSGYMPAEILVMSSNPEYQGLYAARCALGADALTELLGQIAARMGLLRVEVVEHEIMCPLSQFNGRRSIKVANEGESDAKGS